MLHGKSILAVVPARGGSKGIPKKNIYPVRDQPLIAYTAQFLETLSWIDRAIVSTDSNEIAAVAEKYGLESPFRRPASLSGDSVPDWQVLEHSLRYLASEQNQHYDIVLMFQPTSPIRRENHVRDCVDLLVQRDLDAVWTVSRSDTKMHPLTQLTMTDQLLEYYDTRGEDVIARQQLNPLYYRNGVAYAITRDCVLNQSSKKGDRTGGVLIEENILNIDTLDDMEKAELLL
jgi:CMP-N,N'-diacetyllegionaminic acid synthase